MLGSDGNTIRQIKFPADLQPCTTTVGIVTANESREQQAFARFMAPTPKARTKAKTTPQSAEGRRRLNQISTAGLTADLARYFPRLIKAGWSYCLSLPKIARRPMRLYANGGSLTTVAWHTPHAVYWISNTLTTDISRADGWNRSLVDPRAP